MARSTRPDPFVWKDLWSPEQPLPGRKILTALARRLGVLWEMPELPRVVQIGYNPRLRTTLGRAFLREKIVELNPRLLITHPGELVPTLAHELAHVVVYRRYGRSAGPHGPHFRTLMRAANLSPAATHNVPVGQMRRKRRS